MRRPDFAALALVSMCMAGPAHAAAPEVDADGTLRSESVLIRPSGLLSPQARAALVRHLQQPAPPAAAGSADIEAIRAYSNAFHQATVERWRALYPADVESTTLGGVPVRVITPRSGIAAGNVGRVLINLHGGAYNRGWPAIAMSESLPLAGIGRIQVVTVDYRMAPEHAFPAASVDVEKVYRELLKTHQPAQIGIYGCSAGGGLTGQAIAWLQRQGLPRPGAIGLFCAGLLPGIAFGGDSSALAGVVNTDGPVPPVAPAVAAAAASAPPAVKLRGYFDGVDWTDPLAAPAVSLAVLAQFPPTLTVSGTRDYALSNALATHSKLLEAGVTAELLVQEGLGHSQFVMFADTPEARLAHTAIWRFFDRHLAR